ncbi:hypothetical protein RclHR1_09230013 [Rhizophagus clarus]|uniref:Uncharacterized protein n=1 Tax=Rhizophagus clarus TaxID=94130 RepID=A0A2Z6S3Y1_9GLOM|nr:hypothetical protein RclHR1_09230013 [Rhizophagus clarus]
MEPTDDNSVQNSAPSESLQTVPIYNLDASSSDSDSDDPRLRGGPPVGPPIEITPATSGSQASIMSQRQRVQVPQRSYTTPLPRQHERQLSELSAVAESVQTRPSVDEENFFEDDSSSEEEPFQPQDSRLSGQTETPITVSQMTEHSVVDISPRMDNRGLRPLSLLDENVEKGSSSLMKEKASYDPKSRGIPRETQAAAAAAEHSSDTGGYRRSKEADLFHHRESSDLLPLTLVSGGTSSGLSYSTNYAYLSPPFGRVINRSQIMARVAWFSQIVIFNIVYAVYKLNSTTDAKIFMSNLIGLVIIPFIFFVAYISLITVWTYIELKNKGFDSSFTVLYYSPLMIFSIFFEEKKRVDASKFHEVNYGAKWWRFGTTKVREGFIMSLYCLSVIGFVVSDILGRAFNQRNTEVSKVFEDVVPFLFMLVVFSLGFIVSIWAVVEAIVTGSMHGSGEGRKILVGVLPNAFKRKEYYKS